MEACDGIHGEGVELETDADGYLLEADLGDEIVEVIAAAEGIALTPRTGR